MSHNAAPDSWDETDVADAGGVDDLQQKLPRLNVNAVEFVPSFSSFAGTDDGAEAAAGDADKKSTGECAPTGF